MNVDQIRQDRFVEEYVQLHVEDVERLFLHEDQFVDVPCPSCAMKDGHTFKFSKSGFKFLECPACRTLFINPRPTPQLLGEFYKSARSFGVFNEKIFPASEAARRELIFSPRAHKVVELCRKYLSGPVDTVDTLVDIGAGFGTFCEEAQGTGFFKKVIAVEPSPALAESCRRKGLNVVPAPIEDARFDDFHISVAVCFELIEHLFSPKEFLSACRRWISGNGLLVLTTLNIDGFDLQVLGPLSENIDGPEHLNYFTKESICRLLQTYGFDVLETLTPGKLDAELVRKKAIAGMLDLENQPFLKQVLINDWCRVGSAFQQFLAEQQLSSHMWVVARRSQE